MTIRSDDLVRLEYSISKMHVFVSLHGFSEEEKRS